MPPAKVLYRWTPNPVTRRIVEGFDDFDGWQDPLPPADDTWPDTVRSDGPAVPDQAPDGNDPRAEPPADPPSSIEPGEGNEWTPQERPAVPTVCPSCGAQLPDDKHLVSNARLAARLR